MQVRLCEITTDQSVKSVGYGRHLSMANSFGITGGQIPPLFVWKWFNILAALRPTFVLIWSNILLLWFNISIKAAFEGRTNVGHKAAKMLDQFQKKKLPESFHRLCQMSLTNKSNIHLLTKTYSIICQIQIFAQTTPLIECVSTTLNYSCLWFCSTQ